tara:strand:- start:777 stop:1220 length:444 start_codon:yes stop_codon:yes gene_type:complete
MNYTVYNPDHLGFMMGIINDTGKVLNGSPAFQYLVDQVSRGKAKKKVLGIRCAPHQDVVKNKDMTTLGKLLAPSKARGGRSGLRDIPASQGFKGRDWESDRPKIEAMLKDGFSITKIAKELGVTQQALTSANKRYSLYLPKGRFGQN